MVAKLAPKLSVALAVVLVIASATEASAASARDARDSRDKRQLLVRCARALSDDGLTYAHQVNSRVSSCLEQLRVCTQIEGRNLDFCVAGGRACGQVPGALAGLETRLRARIAGQCQGVVLADLLGLLGYSAVLEDCVPTSLDGFVGCLAQRLRGTTMITLARVHPGACELATVAGLAGVLPMDGCGGSISPDADQPACTEPHYCGGPEGIPCPAGQVCNRTDPLCTFGNVAGVCAKVSESCADDGEPVCGCDGTTYASDCHRLAVDAVLRHRGACQGPPASCSFAESTCPPGQFCEFPVGDCGEAQSGECRPMSAEPCSLCTEFMGGVVCGCDLMTYPSDCDRMAAGVPKRSDGPCF